MAERDDGVTRLDQARAKRRAQRQAAAVGEDALALEFAERHDGHFVYDHTRGEWFRWDDVTWRRDADEYVLDCVRALTREHKHGKIRTATSVERAARTDRRLARDHTAWNADPCLLGTPGDVVDLRTGELLAPDASYMINFSTSVRPAPQGAPHPLWSQFLDEATRDDEDLQRTCKQRAGYWLTGDTSLEDFDFFHGPGGNGKGVFLKTITAIMGDYAAGRADQPVHGVAARRAPVRARPAGACPAGDRVRARGKPHLGDRQDQAAHRQRGPHRRPAHAPEIFLSSGRASNWSSSATPSRASPPLTRRSRAGSTSCRSGSSRPTRDEQLKEKLVVEYPAILRWAIDGWLDLQANGRDAARRRSPRRPREYLDDENVIATWLAERCELGPLHEATAQGAVRRLEGMVPEQPAKIPKPTRRLKRRLEKVPGLRFPHGMHGVCRQRHRAETMRHDGMTEMTLRPVFPHARAQGKKSGKLRHFRHSVTVAGGSEPAGRRQHRRRKA